MCCVYVSVCRDQKRVADPLKLDLQAVVSHLTHLMESELRSFVRAASTLSLRHVSNFSWVNSSIDYPEVNSSPPRYPFTPKPRERGGN